VGNRHSLANQVGKEQERELKRFSKRSNLIVLAGALIALAALTTFLLIGYSADGGGPAWVEQNIDEYRATLAVSTDPTQQAFLQDKLSRMESIQQNRLQALRNAPPKPEDPCALRPTPAPTQFVAHVAGVSAVDKAPINPEEFTPSNQWQGEWAGLWVRVYAGVRADDLEQGVIWVVVDNTGDFGSYASPTRGGMLSITAENGLILTLQDKAGAIIYFDVASRQYLTALNEVVPTLVPLPTFTPDMGLCPAAAQ
jgi:hypothetical protein